MALIILNGFPARPYTTGPPFILKLRRADNVFIGDSNGHDKLEVASERAAKYIETGTITGFENSSLTGLSYPWQLQSWSKSALACIQDTQLQKLQHLKSSILSTAK